MKRVLFAFAGSLLTLILLVTPIQAQSSWVDSGYAESMNAAAGGDVNSAAHVSNVNTSNYSDFVRRVLGPMPGITTTDSSLNSPQNQAMLKNSAVFALSSYITNMYITPPASTYAFVQDVGQTLGFIPKQAYAQGIGFSGLSALLSVWKVFRNIAYVVLAIVMLTIGFMVMFRKKIDPKTVVTVQNALPKIVVTLLLVTFSYAIVGILIDIMYVLIAILGSVFAPLISNLALSNVIDGTLWSSIFKNIPESQLFYRIVYGVSDPGSIAALNITSALGVGVGLALAASGNVAVGAVVGGMSIVPALLGALFSIGMLLLFIRLFIFFLSTYIKIVLALVFSPLQLIFEAVPGSKSFDNWIRGLMANILVFPAATALFLVAAVFMQLSDAGGSLWHPPYVGLFLGNATSIGALISIGILFMIPTVGKQIHDALKSKPGTGGLEGLTGAFTGPTQLAMQGFQMWTSHQQMKNLGDRITKSTGAGGGGK